MKNLSRVPRFSYESKDLAEISADVLILPLFDKEKLPKELTDFDKKINNAVKNILDVKDFSGKKNSVLLFHPSGKAKRILLIGLGENKKISMEIIRASISNGIFALKNISAAKLAIRLSGLDSFASEELGQAVVEAATLSFY